MIFWHLPYSIITCPDHSHTFSVILRGLLTILTIFLFELREVNVVVAHIPFQEYNIHGPQRGSVAKWEELPSMPGFLGSNPGSPASWLCELCETLQLRWPDLWQNRANIHMYLRGLWRGINETLRAQNSAWNIEVLAKRCLLISMFVNWFLRQRRKCDWLQFLFYREKSKYPAKVTSIRTLQVNQKQWDPTAFLSNGFWAMD